MEIQQSESKSIVDLCLSKTYAVKSPVIRVMCSFSKSPIFKVFCKASVFKFLWLKNIFVKCCFRD